MKIRDLYNFLNKTAPFSLQEKWDNSGLLTGDFEDIITGVLISLELTEKVLDECISRKFNTIITHHPAIFSGVKKINSKDTPLIYRTLRNGINVISMHTNTDIAFRELFYPRCLEDFTESRNILSVSNCGKIYKIIVYVPEEFSEKVRNAIFDSGGGRIGNYSGCSFNSSGTGTFVPGQGTNPFIGEKGKAESVPEIKIETVVTEKDLDRVISAIRKSHPYEEPAYDIFTLKIKGECEGFGIKAVLKEEMDLETLVSILKKDFSSLRVSGDKGHKIRKVAFCNGSGISLIGNVYGKCDVYITGDVKYHDACEAWKSGLAVIDLGHYETEIVFSDIIFEKLKENGFEKELNIEISSEDSPVFWRI